MNGCSISIVTVADGQRQEFSGSAACAFAGNCARVRYEIEGDEGEICFFPHKLFMKRRGEAALSAEFSCGRQTSLIAGLHASCGEIPVFTDFYRVSKTKNGFFAELDYRLQFDTYQTSFHLNFTVITEEP